MTGIQLTPDCLQALYDAAELRDAEIAKESGVWQQFVYAQRTGGIPVEKVVIDAVVKLARRKQKTMKQQLAVLNEILDGGQLSIF